MLLNLEAEGERGRRGCNGKKRRGGEAALVDGGGTGEKGGRQKLEGGGGVKKKRLHASTRGKIVPPPFDVVPLKNRTPNHVIPLNFKNF